MKKSQLIKIIKEEIGVILNESGLGLKRKGRGSLSMNGNPPRFQAIAQKPQTVMKNQVIDLPPGVKIQLTKPDGKTVTDTYEKLSKPFTMQTASGDSATVYGGHFTHLEGKYRVILIHRGKKSKPIEYRVMDTSF